jgi:hypothetical protein
MRCFDPRSPCGTIGVVLLTVYFGVHTGVVESAEEGGTEVGDHLWMTWQLSRRYIETCTTIKLKILVLFPGYTHSQVSSISSLMVRRVLEFYTP